MPLFKITCEASAPAHPFLGRVIYTNDPGRALVTGKCADVGSIVMQQFRGLAEDALEAVAEQALLRGTSPHSMRAILEEVLLDMYDLPSRTDVGKCVIDRAVVLDRVHPTLVPQSEPASKAAPAPGRFLSNSHPAVSTRPR